MATPMYAGDILDGNDLDRARARRQRRRGGIILGLIAVIGTVTGRAAAMVRAEPGLLVDVAAAALVVAGVATMWGTGWALIAGGVALAAIHDFAGPGS